MTAYLSRGYELIFEVTHDLIIDPDPPWNVVDCSAVRWTQPHQYAGFRKEYDGLFTAADTGTERWELLQ